MEHMQTTAVVTLEEQSDEHTKSVTKIERCISFVSVKI